MRRSSYLTESHQTGSLGREAPGWQGASEEPAERTWTYVSRHHSEQRSQPGWIATYVSLFSSVVAVRFCVIDSVGGARPWRAQSASCCFSHRRGRVY